MLESDITKISQVVECFVNLNSPFTEHLPKSPLSKQEEQKVAKNIAKGRSMTLKDMHYATNIFDAKFNGTCLSRKQQAQGTDFIDHMASRTYDV